MMVYGDLSLDGRVQRAATALVGIGQVHVVRLAGGVWELPAGLSERRVPTLPWRVASLVRFTFSVISDSLRDRPDIVYAHDYYTALAGVLVGWLLRRPVVYDAHEMVEDWVFGGWRGWIFAWAQRLAIQRADLVIAPSQDRLDTLSAWHSLQAPRLVVRNSVVEGVPGKEIGPRRNLVVYQGVVDRRRRVQSIVESMPWWPNGASMMIVGGGPDVEWFRSRFRGAVASGKLLVNGPMPREELHLLLKQARVGVATYPSTGLNDWLAAPNKISEYAAAGVVVLGSEQPAIADSVLGFSIGALVSARMSAKQIGETVSELLYRHEELRPNLAAYCDTEIHQDDFDELREQVKRLSRRS